MLFVFLLYLVQLRVHDGYRVFHHIYQPKASYAISIISPSEKIEIDYSILNPHEEEKSYLPLIYHVVADQSYLNVLDFIHKECDLSYEHINKLIELGAVYYSTTNPKEVELKGNNAKVRRLNPSMRIISKPVNKDFYCRIHVNVKRCRAAHVIDWNARSLVLSDYNDHTYSTYKVSLLNDLVILNKPKGVPCVPTIDNLVDNMFYQTQQLLSKKFPNGEFERLTLTNRLDKCTGGILFYARDAKVSSKFNHFQKNTTEITKIYRTITKKILPLGMMRHLYHKVNLDKHKAAKPTLLRAIEDFDVNDSEWQVVEMQVLSSSPLQRIQDKQKEFLTELSMDTKKYGSYFQEEAEVEDVYYESTMRLVTGKTHQIRLQLAAKNASIIGDTRYSPVAGLLNVGNHTDWKDGRGLFGRDPERIALDCISMTIPASLVIDDSNSDLKGLLHRFQSTATTSLPIISDKGMTIEILLKNTTTTTDTPITLEDFAVRLQVTADDDFGLR